MEYRELSGRVQHRIQNMLLCYISEEFPFLPREVCLSLHVDPYLSTILLGTVQHRT